MPAPSQKSLEAFMTSALLAQGYIKREFVNGQYVKTPTELPDDMKKMVKALAIGLSAQWAAWQASTIVTIPVTSPPGSPSAGVLL